jgi:DNA-binding transcriptional regulator YhcF (GntR family)
VSGYVRLYRTLFGHPAFRNDAEAMAFAWMVGRASWQAAAVRYKGHRISLKRGQLAISQRDMAEQMDRDKGWVERLWRRLRSEAMIEADVKAGVAVITICNYDEYQPTKEAGKALGKALDEADARQTQGTEQVSEEVKKETNSNELASPAQNDDEPVKPEHVIEAWNAMADTCGLPKARMTPSRRTKLKTFVKRNSVDDITEAIWRVPSSDFLCGRNGRDWRADLDFLLNPSKFPKILEGSYG